MCVVFSVNKLALMLELLKRPIDSMVLGPLWPQADQKSVQYNRSLKKEPHKNDDLTEWNKRTHIFKETSILKVEVSLQDDK